MPAHVPPLYQTILKISIDQYYARISLKRLCGRKEVILT